jgi:DNA invertase Pin-like site-specific DNA recombinase
LRGILLAVLATMAKQEAKRLSERVIAGLARARAKGTKSGKPIGRPRVGDKTERAIRASLKEGIGIINSTGARSQRHRAGSGSRRKSSGCASGSSTDSGHCSAHADRPP